MALLIKLARTKARNKCIVSYLRALPYRPSDTMKVTKGVWQRESSKRDLLLIHILHTHLFTCSCSFRYCIESLGMMYEKKWNQDKPCKSGERIGESRELHYCSKEQLPVCWGVVEWVPNRESMELTLSLIARLSVWTKNWHRGIANVICPSEGKIGGQFSLYSNLTGVPKCGSSIGKGELLCNINECWAAPIPIEQRTSAGLAQHILKKNISDSIVAGYSICIPSTTYLIVPKKSVDFGTQDSISGFWDEEFLASTGDSVWTPSIECLNQK